MVTDGQRALVVKAETGVVDREKRTVELSFSSEYAYEREGYIEMLSHKEGAMNLERLNNRAAVLINHDRNRQVGVVESARVQGGKGRAVIKFSRSQEGEDAMNDVEDGIRTLVSAGYKINEYEVREERGKPPTVVATAWTPYEISFASVPVDISVGVGRAMESGESVDSAGVGKAGDSSSAEPDLTHTESMSAAATTDTPVANAKVSDVDTTREDAKLLAERQEATRQKEINAIALRVADRVPDIATRTQKALTDGESAADFTAWVLENGFNARVADPNPEIGANKREVEQFSIRKCIDEIASERGLSGLEKEMVEAAAKKTNIKLDRRNFVLPEDVVRQRRAYIPREGERALTAADFASAGALIGENLQPNMIELLRNAMVLARAGVGSMTGLVGDIVIPRQTGGATAYWLDENDSIDLSDATFGQIAASPKRLGVASRISKQLIEQSTPDAESLIRQDMMEVAARKKDIAGLEGTGIGAEPRGIKNITGIGAVTFGGTATRADALEFQSDVESANADLGQARFLTTPTVKAKWLDIAIDSGSGMFLLADDMRVRGTGAELIPTNAIAGNLVYYGVWSQAMWLEWTGMEMIVDPYTRARNNQIELVLNMKCDFVVRHAGSFSVSSDSGAQ